MPKIPPSEHEWIQDKARFAANTASRDHGFPLGPLAQQFAALTYSLLDADSVADVLDQVTHAAAAVIPAADVVSVTLRTSDGQFHTPVESDPLAIELDGLQYTFDEGPCVDAARTPGPGVAISADLAADRNWPRFGPAAAELGMAAVISTALLPDAQSVIRSGALNVYSHRPHSLTDQDRMIALLLATHASLAVAHSQSVTASRLQAERLRRAIDSRDVIGQAKGILMDRQGISAGEAFDLLRRTSQQLNVKLVEIAETLATRHAELDRPDSADR